MEKGKIPPANLLKYKGEGRAAGAGDPNIEKFMKSDEVKKMGMKGAEVEFVSPEEEIAKREEEAERIRKDLNDKLEKAA